MITKAQIRDDATLILAICASNGGTSTWTTDRELDLPAFGSSSSPGGELARRVLMDVRPMFRGAEVFAEAEAMLRTGWKP